MSQQYYYRREHGWDALPMDIQFWLGMWERDSVGETSCGPMIGIIYAMPTATLNGERFKFCVRVTWENRVHHAMLYFESGEASEVRFGERPDCEEGHWYPPRCAPL